MSDPDKTAEVKKAPPAADDFDARCTHENRYNHCRACMRVDGLTPRAVDVRIAALNAHLHNYAPAGNTHAPGRVGNPQLRSPFADGIRKLLKR